jgi:hypothetical protein
MKAVTEAGFYDHLDAKAWAFMQRRAQAGKPIKMDATVDLLEAEIHEHLADLNDNE